LTTPTPGGLYHGRWGWKPRDVERAIEVVSKAGFAIIGVKITAAGDIDIATGPAPSSNESAPPARRQSQGSRP
jgi:hypothetical protein